MQQIPLTKTDEYWRALLTPEQYHVLREKGTEAPFTEKYCHDKEKGVYRCAACGAELFSSDTKYDSKSGWPSFYAPMGDGSIAIHSDHSLGTERKEVLCFKCGGHLGHVFDDGPEPTGKRYCINSCALEFEKEEKELL